MWSEEKKVIAIVEQLFPQKENPPTKKQVLGVGGRNNVQGYLLEVKPKKNNLKNVNRLKKLNVQTPRYRLTFARFSTYILDTYYNYTINKRSQLERKLFIFASNSSSKTKEKDKSI